MRYTVGRDSIATRSRPFSGVPSFSFYFLFSTSTSTFPFGVLYLYFSTFPYWVHYLYFSTPPSPTRATSSGVPHSG